MKHFIVYQHIRKDKNEPFYIGIGCLERAYDFNQRNFLWKRVYNNTEIEVEILHTDLSWEEACSYEKQYVKQYGRKDKGTGILTNLTDGGDGFPTNHSEDSKNKISETLLEKHNTGELQSFWKGKKQPKAMIEKRAQWLRENYHPSEEHKKILSQKLTGEGNGMFGVKPWNYGKPHTEQVKQKLKDNHKGMTGKSHNKETRRKMSMKQGSLTEKQVLHIRKTYDKSKTFTEWSKIFDVSVPVLKNIIYRRSYKHL